MALSSLTASKKTILDRGFGASTCLNSDCDVLPPHPTENPFYKKQPRSIGSLFASSVPRQDWALLHSGMSSCGNLGDQTAKETRQGAPNKPHNVFKPGGAAHSPPNRRPKVGMLQFFD